MGDLINAAHCHVNNATVTADGKYIFFVSADPERTWAIYWVSSKIIDKLKKKHLNYKGKARYFPDTDGCQNIPSIVNT